MEKPNSIEFEFDLLALDGENAIDNFKNLFGKKLKELGVNYEIFNLSDKKVGGGAIDSGSSSSYPYNMFEGFMDTVFKKNHDIKAESSNVYDMLFRDFKGHSEEDYAKKMFAVTSLENGYFGNTVADSKEIFDENQPTLVEEASNTEPLATENIPVLPDSNITGISSVISSIGKNISDLSAPIKLPVVNNVVNQDKSKTNNDNNDFDSDDDEVDISNKKKYKIISLKLIVQYKDALYLAAIKKG
uniref:Uncharacterized protein n=1 Tax=viral metagenome TaxID=1070528 RepID=A0A6C0B6K7_9ZZZZ